MLVQVVSVYYDSDNEELVYSKGNSDFILSRIDVIPEDVLRVVFRAIKEERKEMEELTF